MERAHSMIEVSDLNIMISDFSSAKQSVSVSCTDGKTPFSPVTGLRTLSSSTLFDYGFYVKSSPVVEPVHAWEALQTCYSDEEEEESSNSAIQVVSAPVSSSAAMVDASPVVLSPVKMEEAEFPVSNSSIFYICYVWSS
uniref:Uncharacterized protein n=1 Tax=Ditylenchus dipsaci TaxID=166011 RepID=A0A915DZ68_9BILA